MNLASNSILSLLLGVAISASAMTNEIIFEKSLADQRKIIVTRKAAPPDAVGPEEEAADKKWKEKAPPGVTLIRANYACIYSVVVYSDDGKSKKEIWFYKVHDFSHAGALTSVQVLDVLLEGETLVFVYKERDHALANVIHLDPIQGSKGIPYLEMKLFRDIEAIGKVVVSAKIQGSIKDSNLNVTMKFANGEHLRFQWKDDKWIKG